MLKASKIVRINNVEIAEITISIDDDCNNGYNQFKVSLSIYSHIEIRKGEAKKSFEGKLYYQCGGGTDTELIAKLWPEIIPFIKLNGCDMLGLPSYPILNGVYLLDKDFDYGKKYLRLTDAEAELLVNYKTIKFAKYLIGLTEGRYKDEVKAAIEVIEGLTGEKYVIKDKVSPELYNDIHYSLITEKEGWNVYKKNKPQITEYNFG